MKNNVTMLAMIMFSLVTFLPWFYIQGIWEQGPVEGPIPNVFFTPIMIALSIMVSIMNLMVVGGTIEFISNVMKARYHRTFRK